MNSTESETVAVEAERQRRIELMETLDGNRRLPWFKFSVVSVTSRTLTLQAADAEVEKLASRFEEAGFSLSYTQTGFICTSRGLTVQAFRTTAKGQP